MMKKLKNFSKVRLEFEHSQFEYYSELDAVEILGHLYDVTNARTIASNLRLIADSFKDMLFAKNVDRPKSSTRLESSNTIEYEPDSAPKSFRGQNDHKVNEDEEVKDSLRETLLSNRRASAGSVKLASAKTCTHITELPYDILNMILLYLDLNCIFNLRSTCKFFYNVCSEQHLFKKLDLKPYWNKVKHANWISLGPKIYTFFDKIA